jgi:PAS domain S-box-containing protein
MSDEDALNLKIGIVGGGPFCKEFLRLPQSALREALDALMAAVIQSAQPPRHAENAPLNPQIIAVADPDPHSEGLVYAKQMGLNTFSDYQELYHPVHDLQVIVIMTPEKQVLADILATKPPAIRVVSYRSFELFTKATGMGEEMVNRTREMETVLNRIRDFVLVITPEKEILEVNRAFLKQMGYARADVIGRKCYEVFRRANYPCNADTTSCPLNEIVRNRGPRQQVRKWVDHQGNSRYIETTVYPVWENGAKISKFVEISRDITARVKDEKELTRRLELMVEERTRQLKETQAKLIHEDKMASLGKLSASVVHEINNPIAGTLNLTLLIKRMIEEGAVGQSEIHRFQKYLDLMEKETRRVSAIVSNLLAFSRQSKMEMKAVAVNRVVERTLMLTSNLLKIHGVKTEKRLEPNLPEIIASEDQLQQVFTNFVTNAAEAMEETDGGVLNIETKRCKEDGRILVSFTDTGVGIPKANLSKLFEPFFTTKKKKKGVGLGLSVAYGIIEEHGGTIHVSSEVGRGATFEVKLPIHQGEAV